MDPARDEPLPAWSFGEARAFVEESASRLPASVARGSTRWNYYLAPPSSIRASTRALRALPLSGYNGGTICHNIVDARLCPGRSADAVS